jgi:phosphatidylinositol kinase/protein kinase (PI-3  family)
VRELLLTEAQKPSMFRPGAFRISSEITMQLLRSNQDCLMSVLEAFVHDPLVEWEDAQRRKVRIVFR